MTEVAPGLVLLEGDCLDRLREFGDGSVDAVVTDPPYELGFMGKTWDRSGVAFQVETWRSIARVLKPGGFLLALGGTRTSHRIAVAIEDAGFEIRDTVCWLYGSGFPKSLDVSKAIDKVAGAERELVARHRSDGKATGRAESGFRRDRERPGDAPADLALSAEPLTDDARRWQGWGTALKPAFEPIVVARKPLAGTVAGNVLEHGTGALNIDGCRIEHANDDDRRSAVPGSPTSVAPLRYGGQNSRPFHESNEAVPYQQSSAGRWPANVVLSHTEDCVFVGTRRVASDGHYPRARPNSSIGGTQFGGYAGQEGLEELYTRGEAREVWECAPDCPVRMLDEQTGETPRGGGIRGRGGAVYGSGRGYTADFEVGQSVNYPDSGGASRFFYVAKASRAERNAGLDGFEERQAYTHNIDGRDPTKPTNAHGGGERSRVERGEPGIRPAANHHPTVKPIALMRWLVRLVTPPGGLVLDPFAGSGTTGIACALEGLRFLGVEQDADYVVIAEARIRFWAEHGEDALRVIAERERAESRRRETQETGQLALEDVP